jgi:hypothetical protein
MRTFFSLVLESVAADMYHLVSNVIHYDRASGGRVHISRRRVAYPPLIRT